MSDNGHQEISAGKNLYRIGEVSRLTDTKPFVLRYWETEFPTLQPVKSPKGHRLYRRQDVDTVLLIKRLLYDEGFTIAGARRHLREVGGAPADPGLGPAATAPQRIPAPAADPSPNISRKVLLDLRDSLRAFLTLLESE
jgi:DNA-binding transcriptional MerR regulator